MNSRKPPVGAPWFAIGISLYWSMYWWFAFMFGGTGEGAIGAGLLFTLGPIGAMAIAVSYTQWPVHDKRTVQRNFVVAVGAVRLTDDRPASTARPASDRVSSYARCSGKSRR